MNLFRCHTAIGPVRIVEDRGSIARVCLGSDAAPEMDEIRETETIREAARQLEAYLAGELKSFSVRLAPVGTEFMHRVWRALVDIPYGCTASYKQVAEAVGSPRAVRAVGQAIGRNPIPIFIPCHRVVGSDGSLTGFRGGLALKRRLLELEGVRCRNQTNR